MLDRLTLDDFAPHAGSRFLLSVGEVVVETQLLEAIALGVPAQGAPRAPFSITFRGPERPILPQGSVRVRHESMGEFDLFVVPIASGPDGTVYEAVFN